MTEGLRSGEYYVHTVYFKDGTKKRIRVTSDEFDVADYYTKRGQAVDRVDYDYQIHSDMTEGDSGAKYKIKSIGKDKNGDYYISPSTGKKVYKSGVKRGDHENPKTGEHKGVAEAFKPPFDKPYTTIKKVVTDKSGAKHGPMSRARDIARMAMKKQVEKMKQPVKESLDESRRMEIVREAMKVAKKKKETMAADDKYQSDPVLSSQINKT